MLRQGGRVGHRQQNHLLLHRGSRAPPWTVQHREWTRAHTLQHTRTPCTTLVAIVVVTLAAPQEGLTRDFGLSSLALGCVWFLSPNLISYTNLKG